MHAKTALALFSSVAALGLVSANPVVQVGMNSIEARNTGATCQAVCVDLITHNAALIKSVSSATSTKMAGAAEQLLSTGLSVWCKDAKHTKSTAERTLCANIVTQDHVNNKFAFVKALLAGQSAQDVCAMPGVCSGLAAATATVQPSSRATAPTTADASTTMDSSIPTDTPPMDNASSTDAPAPTET